MGLVTAMMTGIFVDPFFHFYDTFPQEVQELAHAKAMLLPGCENFSFFIPFKEWNHFSEMLLAVLNFFLFLL